MRSLDMMCHSNLQAYRKREILASLPINVSTKFAHGEHVASPCLVKDAQQMVTVVMETSATMGNVSTDFLGGPRSGA